MMSALKIAGLSLLVLSISACHQTEGPNRQAVSIVSREKWDTDKLMPDEDLLKKRPMGKARHITIHHTQTPSPDTVSEVQRLMSIQAGHQVNDHIWGDIAYHYLIGPSGTIYEGRAIKYAGSSGTVYLSRKQWESAGQGHEGNSLFQTPIGVGPPGEIEGHITVCFIGTFSDSLPSRLALDRSVGLIASLLERNDLAVSDVYFHREVTGDHTDCPGHKLYEWFRGKSGNRDSANGEGLVRVAKLLGSK